MKRAFRTEPEASEELEEAANWYTDHRAGLGVEFIEAFDAALEQIGRWPEVGHLVPHVPADVPARRFPLRRSVELIPECVQGRCSEKRAIRSSLLPTQMSSPTRMAELTRCIAAV